MQIEIKKGPLLNKKRPLPLRIYGARMKFLLFKRKALLFPAEPKGCFPWGKPR